MASHVVRFLIFLPPSSVHNPGSLAKLSPLFPAFCREQRSKCSCLCERVNPKLSQNGRSGGVIIIKGERTSETYGAMRNAFMQWITIALLFEGERPRTAPGGHLFVSTPFLNIPHLTPARGRPENRCLHRLGGMEHPPSGGNEGWSSTGDLRSRIHPKVLCVGCMQHGSAGTQSAAFAEN